MKTFRHTSNIVFGTPWMTTPQCFETIAAIFARHLNGEEIPNVKGAERGDDSPADRMLTRAGKSSIIRIHGPILPRANMGNISSTITGSAEIAEALNMALADDSSAIVLDIDSPGGSVLGGFEAADSIYEAKKKKPVMAMISGMGASLAYLLASQADEIYATRGSIIGSIGVIARIQSDERAALNEGIDSMTVASSRAKAMSGLSENEMRAVLQADVDRYFGMMKDTINRSREGLVSGPESFPGVLSADESMSAHLIDGISTMEHVLAALEKIV